MTNCATAGKKKKKNSCPLDGKCLTKCVVYKATVTETDKKKQETYIGLTENEFKTRFNLHKSSFKQEHKRTTTTLSDHILKLKKEKYRFQHQMGDYKECEAICARRKDMQAMPTGKIVHPHIQTIQ